jgi:hypothetical protein
MALGYLIVPMTSISVYAEDREIAEDSVQVQSLDGPQTSSNSSATTVPIKHAILFPFAQPIGGGIAYREGLRLILGIIIGHLAIRFIGTELFQSWCEWLNDEYNLHMVTYISGAEEQEVRAVFNSFKAAKKACDRKGGTMTGGATGFGCSYERNGACYYDQWYPPATPLLDRRKTI